MQQQGKLLREKKRKGVDRLVDESEGILVLINLHEEVSK